jgi:hypothetical protein
VKYKGNVVFAVYHQIMKAYLGNGVPAPSIRLWIEANDQPHASLALHPVKEPAVAVYQVGSRVGVHTANRSESVERHFKDYARSRMRLSICTELTKTCLDKYNWRVDILYGIFLIFFKLPKRGNSRFFLCVVMKGFLAHKPRCEEALGARWQP